MTSNKILSFFDILEQLYENTYQISKCCYGNNDCLVITYIYASKIYQRYFNDNELSYKDMNVLYNVLYGDYMSTIINQIDKVFEESCNDLNFFHITKLNDIIDNYKIF